MKCLLVDDEPGIREGLAALLRRKGHEVRTAADCAAATAALAADTFDLVVTDWRLPDGTAAAFFDACACPVLAVSGQPEEVTPHAALRAVLTKPLSPARLLEACAAAAAPSVPHAAAPLPRDVALLVDAARGALPSATALHLDDDGTFVRLVAEPVDVAAAEALARLGGDLRRSGCAGAERVELRWLRDGRPDAGIPVVRAGARWPDAREIAVDFEAAAEGPVAFAACLDAARARVAAGGRVHFLNAPPALHSWASGQGRLDDMPMREPVGPRLPAELAGLWS